jgi:FixJ family two-component response regulator
MRKSRTYGSVRGTPGNRRSYRDLGASSKKTIDTYEEHIKEKLNLKSTSQLLRYALQWAEGDK